MNEVATVTNDDGDNVNHGFTMLDIAKHALMTYMHHLRDDDVVMLISYNSNVHKLIDKGILCTVDGKKTYS